MKEISGMFEKMPMGKILPPEQMMQDPIEILKGDHKRVKELFQKFEKAEAEEMQSQIAKQILLELKVHAKLEEEIFYPEVREMSGDKEMMDEAAEEHHVVEFLVAELESMKPSDDRYKAKMMVLKEVVDHHVKEEEGEMFKEFDKEEAGGDDFVEEMMTRKQQLMDEMQRGKKAPGNGRGKAAVKKSSNGRKSVASSKKASTSKKSTAGRAKSAAGSKKSTGGRAKSAAGSKKSTGGRAKSAASSKKTTARKSTGRSAKKGSSR